MQGKSCIVFYKVNCVYCSPIHSLLCMKVITHCINNVCNKMFLFHTFFVFISIKNSYWIWIKHKYSRVCVLLNLQVHNKVVHSAPLLNFDVSRAPPVNI